MEASREMDNQTDLHVIVDDDGDQACRVRTRRRVGGDGSATATSSPT